MQQKYLGKQTSLLLAQTNTLNIKTKYFTIREC